jgi:hypothetical protein
VETLRALDDGRDRVGHDLRAPKPKKQSVAASTDAAEVRAIATDPILVGIADAPDRAALTALWRANKATWTTEHNTAVTARLAQLPDPAA